MAPHSPCNADISYNFYLCWIDNARMCCIFLFINVLVDHNIKLKVILCKLIMYYVYVDLVKIPLSWKYLNMLKSISNN